jgi:hypothetical protein
MFRALPSSSSGVLRRHCIYIYMQPMVSSQSAGDCPVHRLRKNWLHVSSITLLIFRSFTSSLYIYAASGIVTVCRWLSCVPVKKELATCFEHYPPHLQEVYVVILYIKMNVCMFICLFVPYINPHCWTDRNKTLLTSPPWFGRDRRVCMGPRFLISWTFWAFFL